MNHRVIAIGVSTGGPSALEEILTRIPANIPAGIVIVQHIFSEFIEIMVQWLDNRSPSRVKEALPGERIKPGLALIAPGNFHLRVGEEGFIGLTKTPRDSLHRPSADIMMASVAGVYGERAIGVLLTGMGKDGVEGMGAIKEAGGQTIAQDEKTSAIFGMPRVAIERGFVDKVIPLPKIAEELIKII